MRKCKHGHATNAAKSREYNSWRSMRKRCYWSSDPNFQQYGGRGITVCKRWASFKVFLADMGPRPAGTSLDRKNTNGHYRPSNCRWATSYQQTRNSRRNRMLVFKGETMCMRDWERKLGVGYGTVRARLKRGWSVARAVSL